MKKLLVCAMASAFMTQAFSFDKSNDPRFFSPNYEHNFSNLALSGELEKDMTPWASSFWPHIYGGISFRWNDYYTDAPVVRKLQAEVGTLKNEITVLKKYIFDHSDASESEIHATNMKIQEAKNQISKLLSLKGQEHQNLFFSVKRVENLSDVRQMSQVDIDKLSPTEKFDIFKALKSGNESGFKLTRNVLNLTGPFSAYWEGICNGWSSAAIEFYEPEVLTYEKSGIKVTFGSSDLKALLSYYHFAMTSNPRTAGKSLTNRIGERCKTEFPEEAWFLKDGVEYYKSIDGDKIIINKVPDECVDTNPGAFHIALTNRINNDKEGFIAEVVRDNEVWNQPVFAYSSEVISETTTNLVNPTDKTRKQVRVKTRMNYANDGGRMFWEQEDPEEDFYAWWEPTNGTKNYRSSHKDFEYILDIDKSGNIIGGHWLSYERPDFIWLKRSKGFIGTGLFYGIVGYMDDLKDLVRIR